MKVLNIERVMVNSEEYEKITSALKVLDNIALCGDNPTSENAVIITEKISELQKQLVICDDNDNGCFVTFNDEEVTEYNFDCMCDCDECLESEE